MFINWLIILDYNLLSLLVCFQSYVNCIIWIGKLRWHQFEERLPFLLELFKWIHYRTLLISNRIVYVCQNNTGMELCEENSKCSCEYTKKTGQESHDLSFFWIVLRKCFHVPPRHSREEWVYFRVPGATCYYSECLQPQLTWTVFMWPFWTLEV